MTVCQSSRNSDEVVSPVDEANEVEEWIEDFLNNGFGLIWIAYPNIKTVVIYRADRTITKLHAKGQVTGESAIPGFICNVAEFFETSSDRP